MFNFYVFDLLTSRTQKIAWPPTVFKPDFHIFPYNEQLRKIWRNFIHRFLLYHTSLRHVYWLLFPSDENKIISWGSFFGWTYIEKYLRNRKGNCFNVNWSTWTTAYSASTYFMLVQVYSLDLKIERLSFNKSNFHIEPYRVNLKWWLFLA